MRAALAIFSARFRTLLQYRAAAVAGLVCQLFWGLIRIAAFSAFYAASSRPQPMRFEEVVTYVWLGQALFRMIPMTADGDVKVMIQTGSLAYELTRPRDLYGLWYARSIANLAAPVLLRSVPLFLIAGCFLGLRAPASVEAGIWWGVSTVSALLLGGAIQALLTISLIWTLAGDGVSRVAQVALWIFSGIVLPLPLFPEWFQPVLSALPFRGLIDLPFRLYLGHIAPGDAAEVLFQQLAWTFALIVTGRLILAAGMRRVVVQGG